MILPVFISIWIPNRKLPAKLDLDPIFVHVHNRLIEYFLVCNPDKQFHLSADDRDQVVFQPHKI